MGPGILHPPTIATPSVRIVITLIMLRGTPSPLPHLMHRIESLESVGFKQEMARQERRLLILIGALMKLHPPTNTRSVLNAIPHGQFSPLANRTWLFCSTATILLSIRWRLREKIGISTLMPLLTVGHGQINVLHRLSYSDDINVKGPHGSANRYILKKPYTASTGRRTMSSTESCFDCHRYDTYANDQSNNTVKDTAVLTHLPIVKAIPSM